MRIVLWTCAALIVYVYVGYPLLIAIARGCRRRRVAPDYPGDAALPAVCLVIAAHNEESVIEAKLLNSLAVDYPHHLLHVLVVSDGSTDRTNEIAGRYASSRVELLAIAVRQGKVNALNAALPRARGDVVVFSDADTMLARDAVRKLVGHFSDERVGAVSGNVHVTGAAGAYAASESMYYRYERFIQTCESRLGAVIGADGGLYAIRRSLFRPVPRDVVIDDFVISMTVACLGFDVRYEPDAVAHEGGTLSPEEEFQRKVRIVAGGIQALQSRAGVPARTQPLLLWAYASHKVLRWLLPCALGGAFLASAGLASEPRYAGVLAAQLAFYGVAALHTRWPQSLRALERVSVVPYYFSLMNAAAAVGLWRGVRGRQGAVWTRTRRYAA